MILQQLKLAIDNMYDQLDKNKIDSWEVNGLQFDIEDIDSGDVVTYKLSTVAKIQQALD